VLSKRLFLEIKAGTWSSGAKPRVDMKLLTGFDAPSCTVIYLDNTLRDHNLFQAICRINRLDGEDKKFGHIVDYKELYEAVQKSLAVYTSGELEVDADGSISSKTKTLTETEKP
jgi:type I site-specific restriction-modification system R (restriction) subunit